jgi:penicillin-binding protein 1B
LAAYLPPKLGIAGKTGTTDGRRDSWFAGFSGDRLAVVWVGRDDNAPSGLTGASGALTVFGELMAALDPEPLHLPQPDDIEWVRIDPASARRIEYGCESPAAAVELPFIKGSAPEETVPCEGTPKRRSWFRRLFE